MTLTHNPLVPLPAVMAIELPQSGITEIPMYIYICIYIYIYMCRSSRVCVYNFSSNIPQRTLLFATLALVLQKCALLGVFYSIRF